MTRNEKRIEKFLKNPESLRFSQIEKILSDFGFYRIETKGSHAKFKRE
jgi:predicted RNA binding protein YcfA (HicA-like mRNA interferase family)